MAEDKPTRHGRLEIRKDSAYHRNLWRFQRIGWAVLLGVILAAVLGAFGAKGVLNDGTASATGVLVAYERFPHLDTRSSPLIRVEDPHLAGTRFELAIGDDYLRRTRTEAVTPQPFEARSANDELILVFETVRPGDRLLVNLAFSPLEPGSLRGRVRAGRDGEAITFSQFVYP